MTIEKQYGKIIQMHIIQIHDELSSDKCQQFNKCNKLSIKVIEAGDKISEDEPVNYVLKWLQLDENDQQYIPIIMVITNLTNGFHGKNSPSKDEYSSTKRLRATPANHVDTLRTHVSSGVLPAITAPNMATSREIVSSFSPSNREHTTIIDNPPVIKIKKIMNNEIMLTSGEYLGWQPMILNQTLMIGLMKVEPWQT
jgi:hypothetical protein